MIRSVEVMPAYTMRYVEGILGLLRTVALEDSDTRTITGAAECALGVPPHQVYTDTLRQEITSDPSDPENADVTLFRNTVTRRGKLVGRDLTLLNRWVSPPVIQAPGHPSEQICHNIPLVGDRPNVFGIRLIDDETRCYMADLASRLVLPVTSG